MWTHLAVLLVALALPVAHSADKKKTDGKTDTSCDCLDICFNIDTSGSINDTEWDQVIKFVCDFMGSYNNPPDDIHFCALAFSSGADHVFGFNDVCNNDEDFSDCKDLISAIKRVRGSTNHEAALKAALDAFPGDGNRDNDECPDIHIFITDGQTTDGGDPIPDAIELANSGVTTFVIAIGDGLDHKVLEDIARDPVRVILTDFDELPDIVKELRSDVCDTNEFDPACQTCCCGDVFGDRHKPFPDRRNKCCGNIRYNSKKTRAVCCQGKLHTGYDERWTRCCSDQPYDIRSYTCCFNKIVPATRTQDQCCDFTAYNQKHEICCFGQVYKKHTRTQCCGRVAYNPQREICCRSSVRDGCSYENRCCGRVAYNPRKYVCVNPFFSFIKESPAKYCGQAIELLCGETEVWDPLWHTCCSGKRHDGGVSRTTGCCRTERYNLLTQLCCDGQLVDADPAWYSCCGRQAYNPVTHTCCQGHHPIEGVGQCCGYFKLFNHKHEICCGQLHVFKGQPHRTKCCFNYYFGYRPYDIKDELCCNGFVQRGGRHWYCCGFYSYNIKTHVCCYGRIFPRKVYRLLGFCDNPKKGLPLADPAEGLAADAAADEPAPGSEFVAPAIEDDQEDIDGPKPDEA